MFACVVVVEDDFYNVVVLQDVGVRVDAIDGGVVGKVAGGKSGVECRDFRADVSYVVEECAKGGKSAAVPVVRRGGGRLIGSVSKVVHLEVKVERVVDRAEELFTVCWY